MSVTALVIVEIEDAQSMNKRFYAQKKQHNKHNLPTF